MAQIFISFVRLWLRLGLGYEIIARSLRIVERAAIKT